VNVNIEVILPRDATTTDKGRVLERFASHFLETQNFRVTEEVRITAMEVDLLAEDKGTKERLFVECKAYRSPISADVLTKLLGNITLDDEHTLGWLISTYALGKDAKGFRDKWLTKGLSVRRRLQIYDPEALVDRLTSANVISNPEALNIPPGLRIAEERTLLLTNFGEFWAVIVFDPETGVRQSALLYEGKTGARVTSPGIAARINETDSTLAGLSWLLETPEDTRADGDNIIQKEFQSIVQVPIADHWADYRPARPQDFVGRDELLHTVFEFFESVRQRTIRTRILAIKAPSGWGKSSFVLKVANTAKNARNRKKCFVYAVDSRAATSKRFGELALAFAITAALKEGFITSSKPLGFGSTTNPFGDPSIKDVLAELFMEGKVLCLIFDQFEELLYKSELESVFDEIKALCNSVDEAQENVVIGFSWKTDGTIPTEHGAYHLWHNLADRRREVELAPFSAREVSGALTRFSKELGQRLAPQLKRLLEDHCQGYPWLLKKLCIHILDLVRSGSDQNDILVRSLSIHDLFKKDIERLAADEYACIKEIAASAPAEFFRVVEAYGDGIVNQLLDKRLIVRSGPRLSIYWDIFKDYLLTERVPYIPISYVPQTPFTTYVTGLKYLLKHHATSYDAFANELGIVKATAENVVRDLVMIGHAAANRRTETMKLETETDEEASRVLLNFCMTHVLYRELLKEKGDGGLFSEEEMTVIARRVLRLPSGSDFLVEEYRRRLQKWFLSVGLMTTESDRIKLQARISHAGLLQSAPAAKRRSVQGEFLGEAPPHRALDALHSVLASPMSRKELEQKHGRNTISVLIGLGIVNSLGVLCDSKVHPEDAESHLRNMAKAQPTILFVIDALTNDPALKPERIGQLVAVEFGHPTWSVASAKRYGSGKMGVGRASSSETSPSHTAANS
jgi:Holliday junction resolvase-like predicted endonuclease